VQRVWLVGLPLSVLSTRMVSVHSLTVMVAVFGTLVLRLRRPRCAVFRRVVSCSERTMAVFMWAASFPSELVILFFSFQTGQTTRHRVELVGFSRAGCWYGWLLLPSASLRPGCTNAARHAGPMRARPASAPTAAPARAVQAAGAPVGAAVAERPQTLPRRSEPPPPLGLAPNRRRPHHHRRRRRRRRRRCCVYARVTASAVGPACPHQRQDPQLLPVPLPRRTYRAEGGEGEASGPRLPPPPPRLPPSPPPPRRERSAHAPGRRCEWAPPPPRRAPVAASRRGVRRAGGGRCPLPSGTRRHRRERRSGGDTVCVTAPTKERHAWCATPAGVSGSPPDACRPVADPPRRQSTPPSFVSCSPRTRLQSVSLLWRSRTPPPPPRGTRRRRGATRGTQHPNAPSAAARAPAAPTGRERGSAPCRAGV